MVCLYGYVHRCVQVCGGQRQTAGIFLNCSPSYFLSTVSPWAWSSLIQQDWLPRQQESACFLFLLSPGVAGADLCTQLFMWPLGDPNSGPQAYTTSTIGTKPSPQLHLRLCLFLKYHKHDKKLLPLACTNPDAGRHFAQLLKIKYSIFKWMRMPSLANVKHVLF